MSQKSENSTTNPNSKKVKSIPEMTWEEILALPAQHIPREKVAKVIKDSKKNSRKWPQALRHCFIFICLHTFV